jgi:uncharacterized protein YraI
MDKFAKEYRLRPILLIAFLLLFNVGISISLAQAKPACGLVPRLTVGEWARVASGSANNLRDQPTTSGAVVGRIPPGDIMQVVDGPRCADGYAWWQVRYGMQTGWTAEGNPTRGVYWLEPLAEPPPSETGEFLHTGGLLLNPDGCQAPPDDYTRLTVNGATLNTRTLAMLDHAQALYAGYGGVTVNFRRAIMQGSYNPGGVQASFGTHDGGGAVDLSVRSLEKDRHVLADDIPLMLRALRVAGFAAWLRDTNELYKGSPIHIHAIAIGDKELSEAARGQLDGPFGYLRGYNGLPQDSGVPLPDTSGDLVLCQWMLDLGFSDMRGK